MAIPVIDSVTFDKALYQIGDVITATVVYTSENTHGGEGDVRYRMTLTATDITTSEAVVASSLGPSGSEFFFSVSTGVAVPDAVSVAATDSRAPGGIWTVVSNFLSGNTGTAVLTSVA